MIDSIRGKYLVEICRKSINDNGASVFPTRVFLKKMKRSVKYCSASIMIFANIVGVYSCDSRNGPLDLQAEPVFESENKFEAGQNYPNRRVNSQESSLKPKRVISLDFCADQYVLQFVDRENILALSMDAEAEFSYLKEKAKGIKKTRSTAEDALILEPDLIVRSYGGGANAAAFFEKAGVRVLNVGWAGDFNDIKKVTREMAKGLGADERGEELIAEIDSRLAAIRQYQSDQSLAPDNHQVLYLTPSGTTTGSGSLIHEMLREAGLVNFQSMAGWRSLPLERLVYEQPNIIAAGFFDDSASQAGGWSSMRHPIARQQLKNKPVIGLKGSWLSCGAWFAMDGVEALAYAEGASAKNSTRNDPQVNQGDD